MGVLRQNFFEFRNDFCYENAIRYQGVLNHDGYCGLLAFESKEVITLGRSSTDEAHQDIRVPKEYLAERGIPVLSTDRGGGARWHGPGQLVGFPIANLSTIYGDARAVKRFAEELMLGLAHACAAIGVKNVHTKAGLPGLWTSKGKLVSLGLTVKDGFVFHGFSLNVTRACAAGYSLINVCAVPAGAAVSPITSLEQEGVRIETVREVALKVFPYLTVINSGNIKNESEVERYETTYANLVAAVSRSQMAIEHFRASLEAFRDRE